ncbi:unnamed protein product [Penicillium salamii]|uniref:Uncharacterized protein n=1 Tax=Penicillium salamii TaxID=1612424 RepID=A0A9W4N264_9EURO|nr:unnamed protein product [Penicillium salamii]CAG8361289.1 unnamed protein product [Penicillium salamii]CAG8362330.1 unnamed protein product [Penicillium salamii]CAG8368871.1 unnamed protein product [Penicillium salamii]
MRRSSTGLISPSRAIVTTAARPESNHTSLIQSPLASNRTHFLQFKPPFKMDAMATTPLAPRFDLRKFNGARTNTNNSFSRSNSDASMVSDQSFQSFLNCHMRHPWGVVDYYIYLGYAEGKTSIQKRLGECYLLEKNGFRNVVMEDDMDLSNIPDQKHPTVVFLSLPVPNIRDDCFTMLVLAFDFGEHKLQGLIFDTDDALESYEDLWLVWSRKAGKLVIDVSVYSFLEYVDDAMRHQAEALSIGILNNFGMTTQKLPCGFDTVVVIQYLQFISDTRDMLWENTDNFESEFGYLESELRDILMEGSRDAWLAAGRGLSVVEFRQQSMRQLAGMNFMWMQTVPDLRDEMKINATAPPTPTRIQVVEAPLPRNPKWQKLISSTTFLQLLIIFCLSVFALAALWQFMGSHEAPVNPTSHVSLFGWWNSEPEAKPTGIVGMWPVYQIIQRMGMHNFLPIAPEPRGVRLFNWWPFRLEAVQVKASGWLLLNKIIRDFRIPQWQPFKLRAWGISTELLTRLSPNPHLQNIKLLWKNLRVQDIRLPGEVRNHMLMRWVRSVKQALFK